MSYTLVNNTLLTAAVPVAPVVQSIPRYLDGQTKILMELTTTFNTVVSKLDP